MNRKIAMYDIPEYINEFDILVDIETGEIMQTGDMVAFIKSFDDDRVRKALGVSKKIDLMKREASEIRDKIRMLISRARSIELGCTRLSSYLEEIVQPGEKLKDAEIQIGWRKSNSVEIDCDVEDLPEKFVSIKKTADKTAIKEVLKAGGTITGAHLVERNNINIK